MVNVEEYESFKEWREYAFKNSEKTVNCLKEAGIYFHGIDSDGKQYEIDPDDVIPHLANETAGLVAEMCRLKVL
ncbi:MAG: hypothetical protein H8D23_24610 [Candidatus Brocadiales bacterium]|nr:hypothetical protein [Candidatus Brocadiales bacterium]